jgi:hypothetical protein
MAKADLYFECNAATLEAESSQLKGFTMKLNVITALILSFYIGGTALAVEMIKTSNNTVAAAETKMTELYKDAIAKTSDPLQTKKELTNIFYKTTIDRLATGIAENIRTPLPVFAEEYYKQLLAIEKLQISGVIVPDTDLKVQKRLFATIDGYRASLIKQSIVTDDTLATTTNINARQRLVDFVSENKQLMDSLHDMAETPDGLSSSEKAIYVQSYTQIFEINSLSESLGPSIKESTDEIISTVSGQNAKAVESLLKTSKNIPTIAVSDDKDLGGKTKIEYNKLVKLYQDAVADAALSALDLNDTTFTRKSEALSRTYNMLTEAKKGLDGLSKAQPKSMWDKFIDFCKKMKTIISGASLIEHDKNEFENVETTLKKIQKSLSSDETSHSKSNANTTAAHVATKNNDVVDLTKADAENTTTGTEAQQAAAKELVDGAEEFAKIAKLLGQGEEDEVSLTGDEQTKLNKIKSQAESITTAYKDYQEGSYTTAATELHSIFISIDKATQGLGAATDLNAITTSVANTDEEIQKITTAETVNKQLAAEHVGNQVESKFVETVIDTTSSGDTTVADVLRDSIEYSMRDFVDNLTDLSVTLQKALPQKKYKQLNTDIEAFSTDTKKTTVIEVEADANKLALAMKQMGTIKAVSPELADILEAMSKQTTDSVREAEDSHSTTVAEHELYRGITHGTGPEEGGDDDED